MLGDARNAWRWLDETLCAGQLYPRSTSEPIRSVFARSVVQSGSGERLGGASAPKCWAADFAWITMCYRTKAFGCRASLANHMLEERLFEKHLPTWHWDVLRCSHVCCLGSIGYPPCFPPAPSPSTSNRNKSAYLKELGGSRRSNNLVMFTIYSRSSLRLMKKLSGDIYAH